MPNGVRVDASDLRKVAKIAKEFKPELQKQLLKQLRAAGRVGVIESRKAIRQMPSKTNGETHFLIKKTGVGRYSLRDLIAQATTSTVTVRNSPDVRIRVRKTPELTQIGAGGLPRAINEGRWRHPLFGDRDHWYDQTGFEFFDKPIESRREEMLVLVKKALDDTVRATRRFW
jgi:hypothetical protein